ncbi:MAG: hypothetical protein K6C07_03500 [Bacteroidales bacterium]|nr:hypothetical protein [Bacteroidales bacterium]
MKRKLSAKALFVYFILLAWGVIIIVRMFTLVLTKGDAYRGEFKDTLTVDDRFFRLDSSRIRGFRGNVYSSRGELLSTTIPIYDLYWEIAKVGVREEDSAFFMQRVDSLVSLFCKLTPKRSREFYEERVKQAYVSYYQQCSAQQRIIGGDVDKESRRAAKRRLAAIKDSLKDKYLIVKISVDEMPSTWVRRSDWDAIRFLFTAQEDGRKRTYYGGCRVDERYVHHNVYDDYAASVIGSMNESRHYSGLEGYYDSLLAGENRIYRQLFVNKVLVPLRENQMLQAQNGCDIVTTIDVDMQRVVEQALRSQLEQLQTRWGCALLMETATGEIKAISSLTKTPEGYKDYVEHVISESYEPGSTFKLISLIAALDSKKIDTGDMVHCEKGIRTLKWAFEFSDNDGLYEAAQAGYRTLDQFFYKIHQMGLDSNLMLEVSGAEQPRVTTLTRSNVDYHSITHGYAVKMPPVYMAAYYNAIANNGRFMRPYLVKEVIYPNGRRDVRHPVVVRERICSPLTLAKVRACLEGVVTTGTGRRAQDKYYRLHKNDTTLSVRPLLAGKTGTAQLYSQGYLNEFNASFVCYFPSERPKYTCMVLISGTIADGGVVAAPVCREIAEKIAQRDFSMRNYVYRDALWNRYPTVALGYTPELMMIYRKLGYRIRPVMSVWSSVSPSTGRDSLMVMHPRGVGDLANALKGSSAKDAVYLLERKGYRVRLKGAGRVRDVSYSGGWALVTLGNE